MKWALVWIVSVSPLNISEIGHFDTYEQCHAEAVWQTAESQYFDKWACVQLAPKCEVKP